MEDLYFILYVITFRLGIIAAGIIAIILGYRLFCKGVWPDKTKQQTSALLDTGSFKFIIKNGSPGIFFALFGSIIISVMLMQSTPELIVESSDGRASKIIRGEKDIVTEEMNILLLNEKGVNYEEQGDYQNALNCYTEAVRMASIPINNLAWRLQERGKYESAIQLAKVAVLMEPEKDDFLDTLIVSLCKNRQGNEALRIISEKKNISKELQARIARIKAGFCE